MPLALKLRDEDNERINNVLKKLIGLDYVPQTGDAAIDALLSGIGLNLQRMFDFSAEAIVLHLHEINLDWENMEQFGDFLVVLSAQLPEENFGLKAKAIAVYNCVQSESKTFSFDISSKINSAKR